MGVKERVCRSRSASSLECNRAEEGRSSSVWCRPDVIPDQSPDSGLVMASGDDETGVRLA